MKVLLVDDHPLYLEGLRNWLTVHGYDVIGVASDGLTALARARSSHPDLVLMDLDMPEYNGLEVARLLKAEFPRMAIVILAVSFDPSIVQAALRCGALDCLPKNIKPEALLRLLSQIDCPLQSAQPTSCSSRQPKLHNVSTPNHMALGIHRHLFGKLSSDAV